MENLIISTKESKPNTVIHKKGNISITNLGVARAGFPNHGSICDVFVSLGFPDDSALW